MTGVKNEEIAAAGKRKRLAKRVGLYFGFDKGAAGMIGDEAEVASRRSRQDGVADEAVNRGGDEAGETSHHGLGA